MAQDPFYDSEQYRKDGGDGTGHWVYEKVKSCLSLELVIDLIYNHNLKTNTEAMFIFKDKFKTVRIV